jgi:HEAT repeat protein
MLKPYPLLLTLTFAASLAAADTSAGKAWQVIKDGLADKDATHRAQAVQALGLIPGNQQAESLAAETLKDPEPRVRSAAAAALGQMKARSAAPALKNALQDKSGEVVFAAADALVQFGDPAGFEVDYEILMRQRKGGGGLLDDEKEMLHNPRELEKMGFEEGIGFIPFGSMALTGFRTVTKDSTTPVRAKAARALAEDPDPKSAQALVDSLDDEKWLVRTAAAAGIAERNDRSLLPKVAPSMDDKSEIVRYTAAAAVLHLGAPLRKAGPRIRMKPAA